MDEKIFPDLTEVNTHVSTYVCGEGDYTETATWAQHQAHHESHKGAAE